MVSLYQAADVAVLPSLWEGLPNAVLEALACGLPAVVSHAANIDGIVTEGAGFEVPTFAHGALADALVRITALSDDERRAHGRARARAHRRQLQHDARARRDGGRSTIACWRRAARQPRTASADDEREAPAARFEAPAGIEADQRHRDRAQEEAQPAADRLVNVAVELESAPGG